jgi:hypothetical protein
MLYIKENVAYTEDPNSFIWPLLLAFLAMPLGLTFYAVLWTLPFAGLAYGLRIFGTGGDGGVRIIHFGLGIVWTSITGFASYVMVKSCMHFDRMAPELPGWIVFELAGGTVVVATAYLGLIAALIAGWRKVSDRSKRWGDYRPEEPWTIALLVFAAENFGMMFLFFSIGYDPTGTIKPSWANYLG